MLAYAGKPTQTYTGRKAGPIKTVCPILRSLFEIAEERKISQLAIAKGIKVWPKTVNDWRSGRSFPDDIFFYLSLAKFLGVEIKVKGAE